MGGQISKPSNLGDIIFLAVCSSLSKWQSQHEHLLSWKQAIATSTLCSMLAERGERREERGEERRVVIVGVQ